MELDQEGLNETKDTEHCEPPKFHGDDEVMEQGIQPIEDPNDTGPQILPDSSSPSTLENGSTAILEAYLARPKQDKQKRLQVKTPSTPQEIIEGQIVRSDNSVKQNRSICWLVLYLVAVAFLGLLLGLLLRQDIVTQKEVPLTLLPTISPTTVTPTSELFDETQSPTVGATSERFTMIQQIIQEELPTFLGREQMGFCNVSKLDLRDQSSPRFKAIRWLADDDEWIQYPVNFTSFVDGVQFAVRYSLVVFYYSTGGDTTWTDQCNFLNVSAHHCDWNCKPLPILFEASHIPWYDTALSIARMVSLDENSTVGVTCWREHLTIPEYSRFWDLIWSVTFVYNGLSGTIPEELGRIGNLVELKLPFNSIAGEVPFESLPSFFQWMEVAYNQLDGTISSSIGTATRFLGRFHPKSET